MKSRYLLDTHVLLWAISEPEKLSDSVRTLLENENHTLFFSAASIWEIAIKAALNKPDFRSNAQAIAMGLKQAGYQELEINAVHAYRIADLPSMHQDPFDRLLVCQAKSEGLALITNDANIQRYCTGFIEIIRM